MCDSPKISSCCFICRQTISEFFSKDAEIVLYSNDGEKETYLVKDLCPFPFDFDSRDSSRYCQAGIKI